MVRRDVLLRRLQKLDEYLAILHDLQMYTRNEFLSNPERYGSAERFLQLAIETLTDIGNHLIADLKLGVVDGYSDIPRLLYAADYIDVTIRGAWTRMIGFRNILVHDYLDIDREIVFQVLQENLDDFESLKRMFTQFL